MKNPDIFKEKKRLNKNKKYFEGWYFKNINNDNGISFIPGINIDEKSKNSFIQVITNNSSYFLEYKINEFLFKHNPFLIKIGNNIFSKDGIYIDIKSNNIKVNGSIKYSKSKNIRSNFIKPNIMGPFSYIPFMECNHAILSMQNIANGTINLNNEDIIEFNNDIGYIEKDWGYSFPKEYVWCQGNNFKNSNASFMLSIADIPFKFFNFRGVICVLIIDKKEFTFTTYNTTKIIEYDVKNNNLDITLKKGCYNLNIKSTFDKGLKLSAPIKGKMEKDIFESISSSISLTLMKNNNIIFSDTSLNCGVEVVGN